MKTMERDYLNDPKEQFRTDALTRQGDDKMRDSDMAGINGISDPGLPGWDNADEDEETLKDDDISGRDLDTDGGDEWDEANVSEKDLDEDDLEDNDEVNYELHQVKNDQFGSLGRSITNEAEPDPDEMPEEHQDDNSELDYPDDDDLEQGEDDEVEYDEPNEVTPPSPEGEPNTSHSTLGDIDPSFTDDKTGRTSGRLLDHEPGAGINPPEHGAYNL